MLYKENLTTILMSRAERFNDRVARYDNTLDEDDVEFVIWIAHEAAIHFKVDILEIFTSCRNNKNRSLELARRTLRELLLKKEYEDAQVRALFKTSIDYHLDLEKLSLQDNHPKFELYRVFKERFI